MTSRAAASPSVRVITHVAKYCDDRQPPAVAMFPSAWNGASSTSMSQASTNGRLFMSVHAGIPVNKPSRASTSAPEHCAPISCREGSSGNRDSIRSSATTSRAFTPLPISTTSAPATNSIGRCPVTSTPFIEVTTGAGVVMKASSPSLRHRLISAEAMKLSSSLNPSKVTTATCITTPSVRWRDLQSSRRASPRARANRHSVDRYGRPSAAASPTVSPNSPNRRTRKRRSASLRACVAAL